MSTIKAGGLSELQVAAMLMTTTMGMKTSQLDSDKEESDTEWLAWMTDLPSSIPCSTITNDCANSPNFSLFPKERRTGMLTNSPTGDSPKQRPKLLLAGLSLASSNSPYSPTIHKFRFQHTIPISVDSLVVTNYTSQSAPYHHHQLGPFHPGPV